eukprot:SAG11_NODE_21394_length_426_cov_0.633028_1_plen_88_part_00
MPAQRVLFFPHGSKIELDFDQRLATQRGWNRPNKKLPKQPTPARKSVRLHASVDTQQCYRLPKEYHVLDVGLESTDDIKRSMERHKW